LIYRTKTRGFKDSTGTVVITGICTADPARSTFVYGSSSVVNLTKKAGVGFYLGRNIIILARVVVFGMNLWQKMTHPEHWFDKAEIFTDCVTSFFCCSGQDPVAAVRDSAHHRGPI
jgi:hypothetical protein